MVSGVAIAMLPELARIAPEATETEPADPPNASLLVLATKVPSATLYEISVAAARIQMVPLPRLVRV